LHAVFLLAKVVVGQWGWLLAKVVVVGQGGGCWPRLLFVGQGGGCWPRWWLLAKVAVVGQGGGRWPRLLFVKVVVVLWAATDQRIRGNRVIGKMKSSILFFLPSQLPMVCPLDTNNPIWPKPKQRKGLTFDVAALRQKDRMHECSVGNFFLDLVIMETPQRWKPFGFWCWCELFLAIREIARRPNLVGNDFFFFFSSGRCHDNANSRHSTKRENFFFTEGRGWNGQVVVTQMTQMNINPPKKHKLAVGNDFFFFWFGRYDKNQTKKSFRFCVMAC